MPQTVNKPLYELTAGDIASEKVLTIPLTASLQDAAKLLAHGRHSGAPVVDATGRLVGVISVSDIVRSVAGQPTAGVGTVRSCDYQEAKRLPAAKRSSCANWKRVAAPSSAVARRWPAFR